MGNAGELTVGFWDWCQLVTDLLQNCIGSTRNGAICAKYCLYGKLHPPFSIGLFVVFQ